MDNKDRLFRELGFMLGDYPKARLIEQNIDYDMLRFMNLETLVNIVNNNVIYKQSLKTRLVYLSYEDILARSQTSIPIDKKYIERMVDSPVEVISAMTKTSVKQIKAILSSVYTINMSVAMHMPYSDIILYGINKDTIKLSQSQMTAILNAVLATNHLVVDISKDTLILSEIKTIMYKGVEMRMQPCLTGVPVSIPPSDRHAASLYMKFMIYALTNMYEDHMDLFVDNIDEISRMANGPAKERLLILMGRNDDEELSPDDVYNLFNVNICDEMDINKSSSTRIQSDNFNLLFADPLNPDKFTSESTTRIDKNLMINVQKTELFVQSIPFCSGMYNISDIMADVNMEMIWLMVETMHPSIAYNLSQAIIVEPNEAVNNVSQNMSICVFPNHDTTSVSINGVDVDIPEGALVIFSPANIIVNSYEGFAVWFV